MIIHQREITEHYQQIRFSDEQIHLVTETITQELMALVITEDWCPDSLWNLPVLIRMSEVASNLNVRIVRRVNFQEFASNYPGDDGKSHIPTFIFFSDKEDEIGYWSERSAQQLEWVTEFFKQYSRPPMLLKDNLPEPKFKKWIQLRLEHERKIFQESLWVATLDELVAVIKGNQTKC
jgi:hypothetical protein